MDKITQFVETKIAPPLIKFSQLKYVQVIQRTGLGIMSLLVIGSLFLLLASFPNDTYLNFLGEFRWTLAAASGVGTSFIALFTVITTSYALVEWYNQNKNEKMDIVQPMILAVASFLLINPAQTVSTIVEGSKEPGSFSGVPSAALGALGVFSAILVGIVTVEMYRFFIRKKIVMKLPEGVPAMVSNAFTALIPSFFVIVFWWLISAVLHININELITSVFEPLVKVGDSSIAVIIVTLLNRILWSVGIHGSNIVSGVAGTFWTQMMTANQTAMQAGEPLPYTFTSVFMDNYIWTGLFPLALMLTRSKVARLKGMGALALPAAVFNIGEPLIFGLPIMMNPILMIPFTLSSLVLAITSVIGRVLGWIPVPVLNVPWITPAPIKAFLAANGSWAALIFVVFGWVVSYFIYLPFVKALEKQELVVEETME
ncbi:PTS sugar transporter subunit IIC [Vagococcus zengguangii]|uniref:Permease IIC component n=1 Tax=Vagococcus zengguangii TaxID=2571750 RepID=A0A4D7CNX0_9ENTE|nr:PTS transporter subunit EIIC [Vagococcus zengguangii]QCI85785.1 PTS sugar transporter subunit IIC [Vagococcus zengguangii]TLG81726.1 PTS sugar transporter subunit IIC [Vagococcus zengguangii]